MAWSPRCCGLSATTHLRAKPFPGTRAHEHPNTRHFHCCVESFSQSSGLVRGSLLRPAQSLRFIPTTSTNAIPPLSRAILLPIGSSVNTEIIHLESIKTYAKVRKVLSSCQRIDGCSLPSACRGSVNEFLHTVPVLADFFSHLVSPSNGYTKLIGQRLQCLYKPVLLLKVSYYFVFTLLCYH